MELLEKIMRSAGVSGYEGEISSIMREELEKICGNSEIDSMGNVIACKGKTGKKIMLIAHMDEIGFLIKHITKEGFLQFIKIGGIDDRILLGQRVVIKTKKGDIPGIIGSKPPHLQKEEERKQVPKYEDMFIDIGAGSLKEAQKLVSIGDSAIFEPNFGMLGKDLCYAKAVDNRAGCYALLKIMEKVKTGAQVYAVASVQEEVGLKGARTAAFKINPDFALILDTTIAGDTLHIKENESNLCLGKGIAITIIEASGRGTIVREKIKDMLVDVAEKKKINYQVGILEGGMTDGATVYISREGISTGILSLPTRYIHSASAVFSLGDLDCMVNLAVSVVEKIGKEGL